MPYECAGGTTGRVWAPGMISRSGLCWIEISWIGCYPWELYTDGSTNALWQKRMG